jgi:hypothetical protein
MMADFEGVLEAIVVEDYPDYRKRPSRSFLQQDQIGDPVHAVWGIPKDIGSPAGLVAA